jgi:hypothetical protein
VNHDPASDPAEARLSALYQAHLAQAEQPSAASDARILARARDALARPAAKPVASGWRSWLKSSWFGPGLAFATIASLSVVVVSLMPKEDLSVERAITAAPGTPPPSASPAAVATPPQAPAPSAESTAALSATSKSGAKQAPDGQSRPKTARTNESARPLPQRSAPSTTMPAAPAAPGAPVASVSKAITRQVKTVRAPAPETEQPIPFPALAPLVAVGRADQAAAPPAVAAPAPRAAAAAADAGPAQRLEKPSLLSEPTESRLTANPPLPEVRDSAPTYPHEARPSIPLPYTYTTPHAPARNAASGLAAATGSLAGRAPAMAAAPPLRDPAEWIKAIQKLRTEGKSEQVTKELTEFRRQYPLYPLPDALKQLK